MKIEYEEGNTSEFENEEDHSQIDKYLTFKIESEMYGLAILQIWEIVGIQKITPLPDVEEYIKGVINLRGRIISVLDVRVRFGLPEQEYHERTCIIVVHFNGKDVGLIVDSVEEVLTIPQDQIVPSSSGLKENSNRFIEAMGKCENQVVILLNVEKLLFEETALHCDARG